MLAEHLRQLETDLWEAADQLRANSKLTASEYTLPVLGLIFLRQASNRFDQVKAEVEPTLPSRGGVKMALKPEHFLSKGAIFLPAGTHFDYLVNLPESADIGAEIDAAMRKIEEQYENLAGVLPKTYSLFEKDLLVKLLRIFNKEVLKTATGDVFGKIYEYFLNEFAMTGAQEGGEFFTPMSLVQTIVNFIEPSHGIILDPACGSAGMFVQSGYFIERLHKDPNKAATFFGQEKATLNTNLAKMNMAVHGLEANIMEGNTFYEDKHNLVEKCDYLMANPPFNVDKVDKERKAVKEDPRLPFGLPKNDNANYLWIQYFYSYLNDTGRAGFVMASSASDAGHSEKTIREKLVKTGAVDIMVAIGNNFFYTRSLPCTLWFYDRAKEKDLERSKHILMLDARKVFRKVTTTINDFSPEQMENLTSIVKLYRGDNSYFYTTLTERLRKATTELAAYRLKLDAEAETLKTLLPIAEKIETLISPGTALQDADKILSFKTLSDQLHELWLYTQQQAQKIKDIEEDELTTWELLLKDPQNKYNALHNQWLLLNQFIHDHQAAYKHIAVYYRELLNTWDELEREFELQRNKAVSGEKLKNQLRSVAQNHEENQLAWKQCRYFTDETGWMLKRFEDDAYQDVPGLCKKVTIEEVEKKDWSLSPGRYVGVDTAAEDDKDYVERLKNIHLELDQLTAEAGALAVQIQTNYRELME